MAWGVMYNGAWDYPADTRGYTWGLVQELHTRHWAFRYGIAAEPRVANGRNSTAACFAITARCSKASAVIRSAITPARCACWGTPNRADAGNYAAALRLARADGHDARCYRDSPSRNAEVRLGREPGAGDHARRWRLHAARLERRQDRGLRFYRHRPAGQRRRIGQRHALEAEGRCGGHLVHRRRHLWRARAVSGRAAGWTFLIGDGRLNYAPEYVWESYYSARLCPGLYATFDLQRDTNLAFNHDRGPVWATSLRLHVELGKNA